MDATDNNSALGFYQMKLFMSICGSIQNILIRDLFGMLFFVSLHQLVKDLAFFQPSVSDGSQNGIPVAETVFAHNCLKILTLAVGTFLNH